MKKKLHALGLVGVLLGGVAACSAEDPFARRVADEGRIVVGSANFPESQIIGELYAQALEDAGFEVGRQPGIGARDMYLAALQGGEIDIVPEYTGNAAQYYLDGGDGAADEGGNGGDGEESGGGEEGAAEEAPALEPGTGPDEVYRVLQQALPKGLGVASYARAESKDSYRVTPELARQHDLYSLEDLKKLASPGTLSTQGKQDAQGKQGTRAGAEESGEQGHITLGANPELQSRPYGPEGLEKLYGIPQQAIRFQAISDSGGPLTVTALLDGTVDVADIYTTSPALDRNGTEAQLVELADPKRLVLPQNVVPLLREDALNTRAREVLDRVQGALTTEALLEMNRRNTGEEKAEPATIAKDWLIAEGIIA